MSDIKTYRQPGRLRVGDTPWQAIIEEYYWDRLASAHRMAVETGVGIGAGYEGWYRQIEAEAVTREQSVLTELDQWRTLETVPHEVPHLEAVKHHALEACLDVVRRFGDPNEKAMISILATETDAPWAVARYGYMVDKYPYDKICVPWNSTATPESFREVVSHEYAHVVVHNVTLGRAPKWLHEAVAMLAERSSDLRLRRAFAAGQAEWLTARELEVTHSRNRQGEPDPNRTWRAYQQSAWLARYLVSLQGEEGIARLLAGFANNSAWTEIKMRVTGQTAADEALREVYGFRESELFAKTLAWLKG